tara:strand:- start:6588 stop:7280 length:693 start_codon:yes stop_codon:yes gene_type:complete
MPFTNDATFTGKLRPFSDEFANKLRGVASDVSAINSLLPSLYFALQLIDPTGAGAPVFPAKIVDGVHPNYEWFETVAPSSETQKEGGRNSDDLRGGVNTLEVGLTASNIPPGLDASCLDGLTGGLTIKPVRGVVMMCSYSNSITNQTEYYFSCPVSVCPSCSDAGLAFDPDNPPDPEFTKATGQIMTTVDSESQKRVDELLKKNTRAYQDRIELYRKLNPNEPNPDGELA